MTTRFAVALRDRTDFGVASERASPVQRRDADRFGRREPSFNKQLDLPLIREARNDAAVPGRIAAGHE